MRIFAVTTIATIMLGFGSILALADQGAVPAALIDTGTTTPGGHVISVPDPAASQYVNVGRALQRLELEAQLEDFYAEMQARAEGLDEAGRAALYSEVEGQLRRLILGSETYAGDAFAKGVDYLKQARLVLARHLGFDSIPT